MNTNSFLKRIGRDAAKAIKKLLKQRDALTAQLTEQIKHLDTEIDRLTSVMKQVGVKAVSKAKGGKRKRMTAEQLKELGTKAVAYLKAHPGQTTPHLVQKFSIKGEIRAWFKKHAGVEIKPDGKRNIKWSV